VYGSGYRFEADSGALDLEAFRRLVTQAREAESAGRPDDALNDYLEALRLCQGRAGDTLVGSTAASATFAGVDGEFFEAVVAAVELAVRLGRPSRVLAPLRLAARMGQLHEPVHVALAIMTVS
jgi:hypothetical protein